MNLPRPLPLSNTQKLDLSAIWGRANDLLKWPQNRPQLSEFGYMDSTHKALEAVIQSDHYAAPEKVRPLLLPLHNYFQSRIDHLKDDCLRARSRHDQISSRVVPLFPHAPPPVLMTYALFAESYQELIQQEKTMLRLIDRVLNPPLASVYRFPT